MAWNRYSGEYTLKSLGEIAIYLLHSLNVFNCYSKAGVSEKELLLLEKEFGVMGRSQLSKMPALLREISV